MAGPYPHEYGAAPSVAGPPLMYPAYFSAPPHGGPPMVPSPYPGMLPPPVQYPKRRRWLLVVVVLATIAVVVATVTAIVFAARERTSAGSALTPASARTAIQAYLDALSRGDQETVARHTLCGLFDDVKERRSDLAVAKLSSDTFRKQFTKPEVTSIDKIVFWSTNQAQVLFTMKVAPTGTPTKLRDEQGVAQLLTDDGQVLVCSYLLRVASQY